MFGGLCVTKQTGKSPSGIPKTCVFIMYGIHSITRGTLVALSLGRKMLFSIWVVEKYILKLNSLVTIFRVE